MAARPRIVRRWALSSFAGLALAAPAAALPPPIGDPAGIALARRVVAAYGTVPGIAVTGPFRIEGMLGPITMSAAMKTGRISRFVGTVKVGRIGFRLLGRDGRGYVRLEGTACWQRFDDPLIPALLGQPMIAIPGARIAAPRRANGLLTLHTVERHPDGTRVPSVYRIDPATFLIVSETDLSTRTTGVVRALRRPPPVPAARPVCGTPRA
jgi:hypothetical protein